MKSFLVFLRVLFKGGEIIVLKFLNMQLMMFFFVILWVKWMYWLQRMYLLLLRVMNGWFLLSLNLFFFFLKVFCFVLQSVVYFFSLQWKIFIQLQFIQCFVFLRICFFVRGGLIFLKFCFLIFGLRSFIFVFGFFFMCLQFFFVVFFLVVVWFEVEENFVKVFIVQNFFDVFFGFKQNFFCFFKFVFEVEVYYYCCFFFGGDVFYDG